MNVERGMTDTDPGAATRRLDIINSVPRTEPRTYAFFSFQINLDTVPWRCPYTDYVIFAVPIGGSRAEVTARAPSSSLFPFTMSHA